MNARRVLALRRSGLLQICVELLARHHDDGTSEANVLDAMRGFCQAWAPVYDAVFFCPDKYDQPNDPFRAKVTHLQDATAIAVHDACTQSGARLHDLPRGLSVEARVAWIAQRVSPMPGP